MGSDLVSDEVVNVKPFIDNRLLEFVYSLDDEYRYNGKLYHTMLLKYYPEVFSNIPWQSTGKIITGKDENSHVKNLYRSLRSKAIKLVKSSKWDYKIREIYLKFTNKEVFVDYANWATNEDFLRYVSLTLNDTSYVRHVLGDPVVDGCLNKAKLNKDVESLGCLLSLELFFKSVNVNE